MNAPAPDLYDEIQTLVCLQAEGALTAAQLERLESLVLGDPGARRLYMDYIAETTSVMLWAAAQQNLRTAPVPSQSVLGFLSTVLPFAPLTRTSAGLWLVALATNAMLVCLLAVALAPRFNAHRQSEAPTAIAKDLTAMPTVPRAAAGVVARLTAAVECAWAADDPLALAGAAQVDLEAGRSLNLLSGLAEITFDSGARLTLEGPTRLVLRSADECELPDGRLVALVPPPASGFVVTTPRLNVVDLGTEFGVAVDERSADEITVFRGQVEVKSRTDLPPDPSGPKPIAPIRLEAGQSRRISRDGQVTGGEKLSSSKPFVRGAPAGAQLAKTSSLRDLIDVIAGGDGTRGRRGFAIDPSNGNTGHLEHFENVKHGDGKYHATPSSRVLDGCFVPNGRMSVDSAGHMFTFPKTDGNSYDHIWADVNVPWGINALTGKLQVPLGSTDHAALWMHCNKGLTLDLSAIRDLYRGKTIVSFQALLGHCYDDSSAIRRADAFVLVDGQLRYERRQFTQADPLTRVRVRLKDSDRYLTLVTTDGEDTSTFDWVLLADPQMELEER